MDAITANVVITKAKLADSRMAQEADRAEWWASLLYDVSLDEALAALWVHQRESTAVVTPAIIIGIVRADRDAQERELRKARQLEATRNPAPVPVLTDADKAEADRVFRESLEAARRERAAQHTQGR